MYVTSVPNRGSKPTILLRESYRLNGKVKNRTLANLTHLPDHIIDLVRKAVKGQTFVSLDEPFHTVSSWHHGHVLAVQSAMKQRHLPSLIASRPSPQRNLVLAMIAGRILEPDSERNSKLANPRWWRTTTLPSVFDVAGADEDDLYHAMDWLLERQHTIETKRARRHLANDGLIRYDLASSEGETCPLAQFGHNRDGKRGKKQVNYGLLTDERGCPVAVSVFSGNVSDAKTVKTQIAKVRERFSIDRQVGDRGMITQKLIDEERDSHHTD